MPVWCTLVCPSVLLVLSLLLAPGLTGSSRCPGQLVPKSFARKEFMWLTHRVLFAGICAASGTSSGQVQWMLTSGCTPACTAGRLSRTWLCILAGVVIL